MTGYPYGWHPRPGTAGTWDRQVFQALNHAAPPGDKKPRRGAERPPFDYNGFHVRPITLLPEWRWGHCSGRKRKDRAPLDHKPIMVVLAWRDGRIHGRMVRWKCGAGTAYFTLTKGPANPRPCPGCWTAEHAAQLTHDGVTPCP